MNEPLTTPEVIELVIKVGLPLLLVALGMSVGTLIDRRHMKSLAEREAAVGPMYIANFRAAPPSAARGEMIVAEVTISLDYFRSFLGRLRNIIGGRVASYERMAGRARREALLRLVEQARAGGYDAISCVRFEWADVGARQGNPVVMMSVIASATAWSAS